MMKGIRGLLEKDFRLFFRQGGNLFLVLVFVALFFILTGKKAAAFIAMYIPSVLAIYSGNTISYDENGHGYTYLFSLPVNKKIYVREKYIFSFIMTVCGWCIGMICAGIMVLINPEEVFDLEMLAMELITFFVFQAIAGIMIAIRIRFEGEKGRIVLPIEMRRTLDIAEKDALEIYVDGASVILKKYKPSCIFCDATKSITVFKGKNVCPKCLKELKGMTFDADAN